MQKGIARFQLAGTAGTALYSKNVSAFSLLTIFYVAAVTGMDLIKGMRGSGTGPFSSHTDSRAQMGDLYAWGSFLLLDTDEPAASSAFSVSYVTVPHCGSRSNIALTVKLESIRSAYAITCIHICNLML